MLRAAIGRMLVMADPDHVQYVSRWHVLTVFAVSYVQLGLGSLPNKRGKALNRHLHGMLTKLEVRT